MEAIERAETPKKRRLFKNEKGGTDFVELLILIGFIAIAAIVAVTQFGDSIETKFGDQAGAVDGINSAPGG
jgi:Flp pilus assembly pilin Flp